MEDTLSAVPTLRPPDVVVASTKSTPTPHVKPSSRPSGPPLHKIYALPVPIRTFPLPSFYPSNPLSLFHAAYAWVNQLISPPPAEAVIVHRGTWSADTRSVHIKDVKSIRALWEQGSFGKGNYSRSEPNWLKREQARRGKHDGHVAESLTAQRREERKMMKWDRARKEQEAIRRTQLEEACVAPVGPMELLALPNSQRDQNPASLKELTNEGSARVLIVDGQENAGFAIGHPASNGAPPPMELAAAMNAASVLVLEGGVMSAPPEANSYPSPPHTPTDATGIFHTENTPEAGGSGRPPKTVRFSPKVNSTTFQLSDPPSPRHGAQLNGNVADGGLANGHSPLPRVTDVGISKLPEERVFSKASPEPDIEVVDREHLQLTLEEAFYLVFALGVLTVVDPKTGTPFTASHLFTLFRQSSYLPPGVTDLQPDDPFLVHYTVYHHFRSLGWVTRPGIKFGADWMLYNRGPVFSHAEFAVIVLPSYSDPWWKTAGRRPRRKSWHWLHTVNRVQSTALKTVVLAYVDIPPPCDESLDVPAILGRYKVREFIVKRWLHNRNRD
ncbi:tRNA splicing endonuclease subunit sen2 [Parahypoxylon ruwenzoriense]